MRHAKPQVVQVYEDIVDAYIKGPPQCCHTCQFYGNDGTCTEFFLTPPEDFASAVDECPKWEADVPF